MPSLRVAIAQSAVAVDPRVNGTTIRSVMQRAHRHGARLVQFPEGALSGYAKEQILSWDDVDWPSIADELELIKALAYELGIWVVVGSACESCGGRRPHNSLHVIADDGTAVGRYDKRICSNTEVNHFYTPGDDPLVFEVDDVRFGCVLCIEINFPELFAAYERDAVDCVLLSAYPPDAVFATKAQAHAAINNYWIGLSAPAQTRHLFDSALIGPHGGFMPHIVRDDDLVVADIDSDDPDLHVALNLARPWRARARAAYLAR